MRKVFLVLTFLASTTSCQVYRSCFDCPPACGVPCTSLTEIEGMIVETTTGPDLFVGGEPQDIPLWKQLVANSSNDPLRTVWVEEVQNDAGDFICGHYVYLRTAHPRGR